jgi:polysaccharide pyruvyl transferase WcaK-like protein/sulfatase maturation enzyme AslB (radical SAM superfamily)
MCRIWKNKKSDDISPEVLRAGLRNPLYSEVTSIGLNGGEPTLRDDLGRLAAVLFEELPKLRAISLITNAYRSEEVIQRIVDVGNVVHEHGGILDVMVSLDGYGKMHDQVRGKPGNFERAQKVIEFVQSSPLVSNVRIGCTVIKQNVYGLADLLEYCISKRLYVKYRLGIPHQRLYTKDLLDPYALTAEEKYHVAECFDGLIAHYETGEHQRFFYRSLVDQLVHQAPRSAGCDWQHRGATITSKGELLYCAVQSRALGRISEVDSEKVYFENEGHLREIVATKCADCSHDYVGIPPRKIYFKLLAVQAVRRIGVEALVRRAYRDLKLVRLNDRRRFRMRRAQMKRLASESLQAPPTQRPQSRRVLICGWYGTETLGDKGILCGVIAAILQALGSVEITLVSLFPYVSEMTRRQMPELKGCRIVAPQDGVRLASSMDLVVFGGGPLMAIDELADMEAILASARSRDVPTFLAGCGVGPLGSSWLNDSVKRVLSLASLRIYRDESSRGLAGTLNVDTANDLTAEDPAFTWLHSVREKLNGRPSADRDVLLLGLRDFPYAAYARHLSAKKCQAAKHGYESAVVVALEELTERYPRLVIRPLPMCTNHYGDDDRWFYRRLFRNNTRLGSRLDLSLLGAELPPIEYCEAFREARVALTMRFHSLVFALGLEVPAVAIDYTLGKGKVHALAQRFGVPNQDLAALDPDFIVREVGQLLENPKAQARGFEPAFASMVRSSLPLLLPAQRARAPAEGLAA